MLEKLKEGIYRICIPFENIYTSSFILTENNDAIILDSGSNDEDAQRYIIPEITKLGVSVKYLVSSHSHGDHHGGINALKKTYPDAVPSLFSKRFTDSYILSDGEMLLGRFQVLNLKGHSEDCLAMLDTKTKTMISCDCLQLQGVGRYPTYINNFPEYTKTLNRVRELNLETIVASHDYEPLGYIANGQSEIEEYLKICKKAADLKFAEKYDL